MAKNTNKNIVMSGNAISAENVIVAETVTMDGNKTKDDKKNRGITIVVALIGAAATIIAALITVFYERPRPFLPNSSLDAAILALVKEDYPEAIAKADEAIAIEPKDPRPYLVKYTALELSGNHEVAVQTLREGTENVTKRATGGKGIRVVLAAAEISPEEGLATVVDVFRSETFNLKSLALRLLEILVRVFSGNERFERALAELEAELATEVNTEEADRQEEDEATIGLETIDWKQRYTQILEEYSPQFFYLVGKNEDGIPELFYSGVGEDYGRYLGTIGYGNYTLGEDFVFYRLTNHENGFVIYSGASSPSYSILFKEEGSWNTDGYIGRNGFSDFSEEKKAQINELMRNCKKLEPTVYTPGMNIEDYWIR